MRWLFLLLLVLNVFYYVWHQQEAPLKAKEVVSLSLYKGSQQDIQLLSEAQQASPEKGCLYLGGLATPELLESLRQRVRRARHRLSVGLRCICVGCFFFCWC